MTTHPSQGAEVTFACRNPLCERRVTMALYCCGCCAQAHDDGYEIHEDGPLGHSAACNERHAKRQEATR